LPVLLPTGTFVDASSFVGVAKNAFVLVQTPPAASAAARAGGEGTVLLSTILASF